MVGISMTHIVVYTSALTCITLCMNNRAHALLQELESRAPPSRSESHQGIRVHACGDSVDCAVVVVLAPTERALVHDPGDARLSLDHGSSTTPAIVNPSPTTTTITTATTSALSGHVIPHEVRYSLTPALYQVKSMAHDRPCPSLTDV